MPCRSSSGPGQRVQPPGRVRVGLGQQRPPAGHRRRAGAAGHGGPAVARPPPATGPGRTPRPRPPARSCRRGAASRRCPRRHRPAAAQHGAQRRQRVVGQPPRPHQVPDRRRHGHVGRAAPVGLRQQPPGPVGQHPEEQPAAAVEHRQHRLVQRGHGDLRRGGQQQRGGVARAPAPASRRRRAGPRARPDDLAGRGQLVQHGWRVAGHPAGQHQRLQRRSGHGRPGQLLERVVHRVRPGRPPAGRAACPGPGPQHAGQRSARRAGTRPVPPAAPARPPCGAVARQRRRSRRSTSASHHSVPRPPGRNSPSTTRPLGRQPPQRAGHHRRPRARTGPPRRAP